MASDWEEREEVPVLTRRQWIRAGVATAALAAVSALGTSVAGQLLPPPIRQTGQIREEIHYTRFPTSQWWDRLAGQRMRVSEFEEWRGATGTWRGLFREGRWLPGTGYKVLVIRVKRDDAVFRAPSDVVLPEGFRLYYDDPSRDVRIVAFHDLCTHLCGPPAWQTIESPPPEHKYVVPAPTYEIYRLDPIYCVWHGSQYEPMRLVWDVHPKSGARYVGAQHVHGPTQRALPVVPLQVRDGVLIGGMPDPRWYSYCS
ncbi:MAG: hypothetical protein ACT4OI_01525 [Methanobacteriota archaeon]